jgi:hypothetical protein
MLSRRGDKVIHSADVTPSPPNQEDDVMAEAVWRLIAAFCISIAREWPSALLSKRNGLCKVSTSGNSIQTRADDRRLRRS